MPVQQWTVEQARRHIEGRSAMDRLAPDSYIAGIEAAKPRPVPAISRGLALPLLTPARTADAIRSAKAKGFTAVYYPVLFDGYASFQTTAFPLHPSLKGADGWAVAQTAAKEAGLTLFGTIDVLSWRRWGGKVHWLTKHPDWIDLDVAGRSRGAWLDAHPESDPFDFGVAVADCVRPSEPGVESRLKQLLGDFAKRAGTAGIAFADWLPGAGDIQADRYQSSLGPPALGYTVTDRLASFSNLGRDPVDVPKLYDSRAPLFVPRSLRSFETGGGGEVSEQPWIDLTSHLLDAARKLNTSWTITLFDRGAIIDPKRNENTAPGQRPFVSSHRDRPGGLLLNIRPKSANTTDSQKAMLGDRPYIVWYIRSWNASDTLSGESSKPSIIIDLRAAPDDITETLSWITAPPK